MSACEAAPHPTSPLGRYRLLAPSAAVRVSPLCLGSMNFGNAWKDYMGECDQQTAESLLDFYYAQGGNFVDTSNNYQCGESETWIGEWMRKRGIRDEMVIATKYSTNFREGHNQIMANFTGNSSKSLHTSIEASLRKLKTDYVDLLYVHWWDFSTSIPELMQSLNRLVLAGRVIYLGASDMPAWVVSKANQYARDHGLRQFCIYQGRWSAAQRDFERDIIPMARDEGMALAPWGSLGGGDFKSQDQRKAQEGRRSTPVGNQVNVSDALEAVARRNNTIITSVALAYVMHKAPYVFPVVGGRTVKHLKQNIEALTLRLSQEDVEQIEDAAPFDIGFPNNFFYRDEKAAHPNQIWLLQRAAVFDYVPIPKPIEPANSGE